MTTTERTREINREASRRYRAKHPDRRKITCSKWDKGNPEKRFAISRKHYLKRYGITIEQVEAMKASQGNACTICKEAFTATPCVDHEHIAGYDALQAAEKARHVRGLLCDKCNNGLGRFDDSPLKMFRAIAYMEQYNSTKHLNN